MIDIDNLRCGDKFNFGPSGKATLEVLAISSLYQKFHVVLNGNTKLKVGYRDLYLLVNGTGEDVVVGVDTQL
jgi:hypothetical protein